METKLSEDEPYINENERKDRFTRKHLLERYKDVRGFSEVLSGPLEKEDYVVQSMPDVSPTKWHLAHTSWFFETFVLAKALEDYTSPNEQYAYLFNSYYVQAGERHHRPKRGLISRPTVDETFEYRKHIDKSMEKFINDIDDARWEEFATVVEIGIHHEQQHQELMLTDIKHVFSENPLKPAYINDSSLKPENGNTLPEAAWVEFEGGVREIGHPGGGFGYDNEFPSHKVYLDNFALQSRLVTNGEYIEFINDGGYETPELWLSEGWATVEVGGWAAPFYWELKEGLWRQFALSGMNEIDMNEPVCHLSYFEADAYARWAGARLPNEAEWEIAAGNVPLNGTFAEDRRFHPEALKESSDDNRLRQMYGDVWEWTQSAYNSYPGFKTLPGALGEYNGKFMCNQFVLRGGSCATSKSHIRKTYRNFFPPDARWQFTGLRLAKKAS